jgi:nucleoside-diphosphate-sugar epimerase
MSTVAVTGASGYIASSLIKKLLEKGYNVNGTVRSLENETKTQHLLSTVTNSNQKGKLKLFEADLLEKGSFKKCFENVDGIFHLASPFQYKVSDPQKDLVDPAVNGTINVLTEAFNHESIKKIVLTSSIVSIRGDKKPGYVYSEKDWNDTATLTDSPYPFSKVKAELKAWELIGSFKKQNPQRNIELVTINPGFVLGPTLSSRDDSVSVNYVKYLMNGKIKVIKNSAGNFSVIDVRDVVTAHIAAMENEKASGRYLTCHSVEISPEKFVSILRKKFPNHSLPKEVEGEVSHLYQNDVSKVIELIGELIPIEKTLEDMGNSLIDFGLVSKL